MRRWSCSKCKCRAPSFPQSLALLCAFLCTLLAPAPPDQPCPRRDQTLTAKISATQRDRDDSSQEFCSKIPFNKFKTVYIYKYTLMVPTALMASIRGSWSLTCSPPTADMTISISCSFNIFSINSLSLTVPCNTNKKWQKSYLKNVSKSHAKMKRNNHENHVQRTRNKKAPLSLNASTILALLQELPGLGRTRT